MTIRSTPPLLAYVTFALLRFLGRVLFCAPGAARLRCGCQMSLVEPRVGFDLLTIVIRGAEIKSLAHQSPRDA